MQQLSKAASIINHLYPGIAITLGFTLLTPYIIQQHYPPQLSILACIVLIALPVMLLHLSKAKKKASVKSILALNGYTNKLSAGKLLGYAVGIVVLMYVIWGITQPLNAIITQKFFYWLPAWYTVQDFDGYTKETIQLTLILNLVINGFLAPVVEELYFRGYLLPKMQAWGKWAFVVNTVLFALYHFWQPYIYLTLLLALLPMIYLVWKTKDLRLAILTHCLLNLVGALLSFGLVLKG